MLSLPCSLQVKATLVFTEAHVSDEGDYFCNISLRNYPTHYNSSQHAQLMVNGKGAVAYAGIVTSFSCSLSNIYFLL